jgi:ABC-type nitrate/sulfonate/bicarbonate transport system substrate-binding protein
VIALPIALSSHFPFRDLVVRPGAGIGEPADLSGTAIGANTWAQPIAVWLRGILQSDYRLDLGSLRWRLVAQDPIADLALPPNVERVLETSIPELLEKGRIDAAVWSAPADTAHAEPLFADAESLAREWFVRTGVVPIFHLIVVSERLARTRPEVAREVFGALVRAREVYLAELAHSGARTAADRDVLETQRITRENPMACGFDQIQPSMDMLLDFLRNQHFLGAPVSTETLFLRDIEQGGR